MIRKAAFGIGIAAVLCLTAAGCGGPGYEVTSTEQAGAVKIYYVKTKPVNFERVVKVCRDMKDESVDAQEIAFGGKRSVSAVCYYPNTADGAQALSMQSPPEYGNDLEKAYKTGDPYIIGFVRHFPGEKPQASVTPSTASASASATAFASASAWASAPGDVGNGEVVYGTTGEEMDLGPSTVKITGAYQSRENPPKGYGGHFEGTYVLVTYDYTSTLKHPVKVTDFQAPFYLLDAQGRQYLPSDEGYGSTLAMTQNMEDFTSLTDINPEIPQHLYESFRVNGEDVFYTLRGGDIVHPERGAGFEVDLGSDLPTPKPPPCAPATAVASASVGASITPDEMQQSSCSSASASASAQ